VQGPYKAAGQALEVIPRTLAQNCGANVIRALTKLRAKHSEKGGSTFGIDGNKGTLWHSLQCLVELQTNHSTKR
jgi:T-complex protein 1 subunit gamma